eukprot:7942-Heterococcus_DN1.PRE.2
MKQMMLHGAFQPFKAAFEKGLGRNGSSLQQKRAVAHMSEGARLTVNDVLNCEICPSCTSCLLEIATLHVVNASAPVSGHLLVADAKPKKSALSKLIMLSLCCALDASNVVQPGLSRYTGLASYTLDLHAQAAYNNTTEIELELDDSGTRTVQEPSSSLFPIGTEVARQFDDDDDDLICTVLRYTRGGSGRLDLQELQKATQDYIRSDGTTAVTDVVAAVKYDVTAVAEVLPAATDFQLAGQYSCP